MFRSPFIAIDKLKATELCYFISFHQLWFMNVCVCVAALTEGGVDMSPKRSKWLMFCRFGQRGEKRGEKERAVTHHNNESCTIMKAPPHPPPKFDSRKGMAVAWVGRCGEVKSLHGKKKGSLCCGWQETTILSFHYQKMDLK